MHRTMLCRAIRLNELNRRPHLAFPNAIPPYRTSRVYCSHDW